ncbi:hypothetical protein D3C80_1427030 [compost metagenome]
MFQSAERGAFLGRKSDDAPPCHHHAVLKIGLEAGIVLKACDEVRNETLEDLAVSKLGQGVGSRRTHTNGVVMGGNRRVWPIEISEAGG